MADHDEQPVGSVERGRALFAAAHDKAVETIKTPALRRGRELFEARHAQPKTGQEKP